MFSGRFVGSRGSLLVSVKDKDSNPVAAANVTILAASTGQLLSSGLTDFGGKLQLTNLIPGVYVIKGFQVWRFIYNSNIC